MLGERINSTPIPACSMFLNLLVTELRNQLNVIQLYYLIRNIHYGHIHIKIYMSECAKIIHQCTSVVSNCQYTMYDT